MTLMRFDLLDGKPPVQFTLKPDDVTRFMDFMTECTKYKNKCERLQIELRTANDLHHQCASELWDLKNT